MKSILSSHVSRAFFAPSRVAIAAALALGVGLAQAGLPYPTRTMPAARDAGVLAASQPVTLTVTLKLANQAELERLVAAQHTPGNPEFRKFITPAQFHARFAPSAQAVAESTAFFKQAGFSVQQLPDRRLRLTGAPAAVQKAFGVTLHQHEVAAQGKVPGYRFYAPTSEAKVASSAVAAHVEAVFGLSNRPAAAPHSVVAQVAAPGLKRQGAVRKGAATGNDPGFWTVSDLAQYYNVQPLYDKGLHGEGKTVGIVTLASFTPSDAFGYWSDLGLTVDPNRLTIVDVDGGPGAPSDASGSSETTLDVEQSGGLAPAAAIRVYQAPNTSQAFVDAFAAAIEDNIADSLSVSWGLFEGFDTYKLGGPVYLPDGSKVSQLKAYDQLFLQAAAQGQSLFASSGDAGAYEINRAYGLPTYSATLSVGAPGESAWITSAGGTTLPGTQVYTGPDGGPFPIDIPTEQAWSWSYLHGLIVALGYDDVSGGIFPVGGGGGVSSFIRKPDYQKGLKGMRTTEPGQVFEDTTTTPPTVYFTLPTGFYGRNIPDVSLNADPETGYIIPYTSDYYGGHITYIYSGGTSFVAPQLNGIAALLQQKVGGRIGLLNYPLYSLAHKELNYSGNNAPLRDITAGDNWFYTGGTHYDNATGVGAIDVNKLAHALAGEIEK